MKLAFSSFSFKASVKKAFNSVNRWRNINLHVYDIDKSMSVHLFHTLSTFHCCCYVHCCCFLKLASTIYYTLATFVLQLKILSRQLFYTPHLTVWRVGGGGGMLWGGEVVWINWCKKVGKGKNLKQTSKRRVCLVHLLTALTYVTRNTCEVRFAIFEAFQGRLQCHHHGRRI